MKLHRLFSRRSRYLFFLCLLCPLLLALLIWLYPHPPSLLTITPTDSFHNRSITITLISTLPFSQIYYTLDGTEPAFDNPNTTLYHQPFLLPSPQTTLIKAKVLPPFSQTLSETYSQIYFLDPQVNDRFTLPVVSVTIDQFHLDDFETGIAVPGRTQAEYLTANPNATLDHHTPANYLWRGQSSERPAHFDFFINGQKILSQDVGLRLNGGGVARMAERKNFKLTARRLYSPNTGKFHYPFFSNYTTAPLSLGALQPQTFPIQQYEALTLRLPHDTTTFIRDEFGAELFRQAGFLDYQPFQPVTAFVNGEYYGLTWLKPSINEEFLATRYATNDQAFQILKLSELATGLIFHNDEVTNAQALAELNDAFSRDLTHPANFTYLNQLVDLDNLLLYYALEISLNNLDWPHNNYRLYRYQGQNSSLHPHLDGRWRYLAFDFDWIFEAGDDQLVTNLTNPTAEKWYSPVLTNLLKHPDLQSKFASYTQDLRASVLSPSNLQQTLDRLGKLTQNEIEAGRQTGLYPESLTENQLQTFRQEMLTTATHQARLVQDFLRENYHRSDQTYQVKINFSPGIQVTLNSQTSPLLTTPQQLTGEYFFQDSVPFSFTTTPAYTLTQFTLNEQPQALTTTALTLSAALAHPYTHTITINLTAAPSPTLTHPFIYEVTNADQNDTLTLKNLSSTPLPLGHFCLSHHPEKLCQMPLPQLTLAPQATLKLFSQTNRTSAAYHQYLFPFNLQTGELLYLTDTTTNQILHQLALPPLTSSQTYRYQPSTNTFEIIDTNN